MNLLKGSLRLIFSVLRSSNLSWHGLSVSAEIILIANLCKDNFKSVSKKGYNGFEHHKEDLEE